MAGVNGKPLRFSEVRKLLPALRYRDARTVLEDLRKQDPLYDASVKRVENVKGRPLEFANKPAAMRFLVAAARVLEIDPPPEAALEGFASEAAWVESGGDSDSSPPDPPDPEDSGPGDEEAEATPDGVEETEDQLQRDAQERGPEATGDGESGSEEEDPPPKAKRRAVQQREKKTRGDGFPWGTVALVAVCAVAAFLLAPRRRSAEHQSLPDAGAGRTEPAGSMMGSDDELTSEVLRRCGQSR